MLKVPIFNQRDSFLIFSVVCRYLRLTKLTFLEGDMEVQYDIAPSGGESHQKAVFKPRPHISRLS